MTDELSDFYQTDSVSGQWSKYPKCYSFDKMEEIKLVMNNVRRDEAMRKEEDDIIANFNVKQAEECHEYHKTIPGI